MRLDINSDGKPDILERWWNGKRVRWLDENGDLLPTDTRGDQVADVMQIDKNGDGIYDTALDISIKWADNDGDGRPDLQAFVTQGREWSNDKWNAGESHWMVYIDVEKDGVLGWLDWQKYDFGNDNWGYTGHNRLAARLQRRLRVSQSASSAAVAARPAAQLGKPVCLL